MPCKIILTEDEYNLLCDMVWDAEQLYFRKIDKMAGLPAEEFIKLPAGDFKMAVMKQTAALRLRDKIAEEASYETRDVEKEDVE